MAMGTHYWKQNLSSHIVGSNLLFFIASNSNQACPFIPHVIIKPSHIFLVCCSGNKQRGWITPTPLCNAILKLSKQCRNEFFGCLLEGGGGRRKAGHDYSLLSKLDPKRQITSSIGK
jgi:hypothetical protein